MIKFRHILVLCIKVIFFLTVANQNNLFSSPHPLKAEISAQSAILINANTGRVLFEKNSRQPSYPASITKMATAWYALEKKGQEIEEIVVAKPDSLKIIPAYIKKSKGSVHPSYRLEPDGTSMGILAGEEMTLWSLLHGLMLSSGNDAANVIAQHVSGNIDQFIDDLNQFLKEKGIKDTHFNNPHGLHHPEHYTTAYDMAMIAKEAMKNPLFQELVKTVQYTRPETNKQQASTLLQANRLLRKGPFFYPSAIGIKTGYHSKAGYTLVAAAEKESRTLVAVLLGCVEANHRYRDAINLFEAAFNEKKILRTLFSKEYDTFSRHLKGAKRQLIGSLSEDLKLEYYPSEEPEFKAMLYWNETSLPIKQGEIIGEIHVITPQGESLRKVDLVSSFDVEMTGFSKFLRIYQKMAYRLIRPTVVVCLLGIFGSWIAVYFLRKKMI